MPTRDNNGFRKLLVVLSRAGKLTLGGFFGGLAFLLLPYAMHVTRGYMLSWILHWPYLW